MDLLNFYDSETSCDADHRATRTTETASPPPQSSATGRHRQNNKRKRGSVNIVPMEQAPVDLFQRAVPHKRGHWAGHVLVPVNCDWVSSSLIDKHIAEFQELLEHNGYSGTIVKHSQLHMSLSKYFSLQLGFLDSFVDNLSRRLASERSTRLFVKFGHKTILVNDDKTRSFWSWKVQPNQSLLRIVQHVDAALNDYKMPLYYDPPTFHISLASYAGNLEGLRVEQKNKLSDVSSTASDSDDEENGDDSETKCLNVDRVLCKFGTTKSYSISLAPL